jgi:hypothetical protein
MENEPGEAVIGQQLVRFVMMIALSDSKTSEFLQLPPEQQFALGRTFGISPEDLTQGLEQFHAIMKAGISHLRALVPSPSGEKSN